MGGGSTAGLTNFLRGKSAQVESKAKEWTIRSKAHLPGATKEDKAAAELAKIHNQGIQKAAETKKAVDGYASSASSFVSKQYSSAKSSITGEKAAPTGTFGKVQSWWKGKDPTPGSSSFYDNVITQKLNKTFTPDKP